MCHRPHGDYHPVCVGSAVVVEQAVFAAGDFGNLVHVFLNHSGHILIGGVACLAVLEENVAVFGHASRHGRLWGESVLAEACKGFAVKKWCELLLFDSFDFLDFV